MKRSQTMKVMHDEPHFEKEPYYEIHLYLTYMTEREFKNALLQLHNIQDKFDVVLRDVVP